MYSGTLIDDLMATVARAEEHAYSNPNSRDEKAAYRYVAASALYEMVQREPNLVGAA